jgi:hypothetical protein
MALVPALSKNSFSVGAGPPEGKSPAVGRAVFYSVFIVAGVSRSWRGIIFVPAHADDEAVVMNGHPAYSHTHDSRSEKSQARSKHFLLFSWCNTS